MCLIMKNIIRFHLPVGTINHAASFFHQCRGLLHLPGWVAGDIQPAPFYYPARVGQSTAVCARSATAGDSTGAVPLLPAAVGSSAAGL